MNSLMVKKFFAVTLIGAVLLIALAGCQAKPAAVPVSIEDTGAAIPVDLEIKEKMFVAQTNDVYFNPEDYLGKTIKLEGIFSVLDVPETNMTYYSVIRYGPGCCGVDANAGFEVEWDKAYPKQDDWVEAVGVLESYEEDGSSYLRLALSSLKVLPVRGEEYVNQ